MKTKKLTIKQVQQQITDQVVASLKQGLTWQQAFNGLAGGLPKSVSTGKAYTGCNVILLAMKG